MSVTTVTLQTAEKPLRRFYGQCDSCNVTIRGNRYMLASATLLRFSLRVSVHDVRFWASFTGTTYLSLLFHLAAVLLTAKIMS